MNQPQIGATLTQVALSIHLGVQVIWITRNRPTVRHRGETWQAVYRNKRLRWYERVESAVQQDGAVSMK